MATADQIKALIRSHADGDDARFCTTAEQVTAQATRMFADAPPSSLPRSPPAAA